MIIPQASRLGMGSHQLRLGRDPMSRLFLETASCLERPDWLAGATGFEPLHLRRNLPRLSAWGQGSIGLQVREPHFQTSFGRP
jgi:hypothetical protein